MLWFQEVLDNVLENVSREGRKFRVEAKQAIEVISSKAASVLAMTKKPINKPLKCHQHLHIKRTSKTTKSLRHSDLSPANTMVTTEAPKRLSHSQKPKQLSGSPASKNQTPQTTKNFSACRYGFELAIKSSE